jgi:hypothetical protein
MKFSEHSRNIQGAFREIQGNFRESEVFIKFTEHSRNIQGNSGKF